MKNIILNSGSCQHDEIFTPLETEKGIADPHPQTPLHLRCGLLDRNDQSGLNSSPTPPSTFSLLMHLDLIHRQVCARITLCAVS